MVLLLQDRDHRLRMDWRDQFIGVARYHREAAAGCCALPEARHGELRWSRLFGQFGGEVKLIPGFDHAASWSVSVAGACPGNGRFSFAP